MQCTCSSRRRCDVLFLLCTMCFVLKARCVFVFEVFFFFSWVILSLRWSLWTGADFQLRFGSVQLYSFTGVNFAVDRFVLCQVNCERSVALNSGQYIFNKSSSGLWIIGFETCISLLMAGGNTSGLGCFMISSSVWSGSVYIHYACLVTLRIGAGRDVHVKRWVVAWPLACRIDAVFTPSKAICLFGCNNPDKVSNRLVDIPLTEWNVSIVCLWNGYFSPVLLPYFLRQHSLVSHWSLVSRVYNWANGKATWTGGLDRPSRCCASALSQFLGLEGARGCITKHQRTHLFGRIAE